MQEPNGVSWAKRLEDFVARHRYVSFTVLFAVMYVAMRFYQFQEGLGLLWSYDGMEQQYPFFIAEGRWLHEFGANILSGSFAIPQWTMSSGYGIDYIDVLAMTLGNPFNLLSVFADGSSAELLLTVAATAQLYVAGIVFLQYCKQRALDPFTSVVGSAVYVFSGYSVIIFSQLYMVYPLVLAPLALMGVDKVFARENPLLFVVAMALFGLYGVTTTYAACLLLLVYCLVRYFLLDEPMSPLGFLKWFLKIAGLVALGLLVACVLLVPTAYTVLGQGRLGLERPHDVFYTWWYYVCTFTGLLYPVSVGADCFIGFAPIVLFCVLAVVVGWKRGDRASLALVIMIAFMAVVLCLPALGRLFNGFAYPNNRWVWALSLAGGIAVAQGLPQVEGFSRNRRWVLLGACVVFAVAEIYEYLANNTIWYLFVGLLVFGVLVAAYAALGTRHSSAWRLVALASAPVWIIAMFAFWWAEWPSLDAEWNGSYREFFEESPAYSVLAEDYDAGASYHYDSGYGDERRNGSLATGVPGSTFFTSYYNSWVDEYHTELGLASAEINFDFVGFEGRTSLEALAGVKYLFAKDGNEAYVPALYERYGEYVAPSGDVYGLYETDSALPLVTRYEHVVSPDSYRALSMTEKQMALLQAMVVSSGEEDAAGLDYSMLTEADWSGGFSPEGGTISLSEDELTVTVNAEIPAGSMAYVEIEGLKGGWQPESKHTYFCASFNAGGVGGLVYEYTPSSHMFAGKENWVVSLGKVDYDRHSFEVSFSWPDEYVYSGFRVMLEDDSKSAALAGELAASADADVRYAGNVLSGQIDAGDEGGYYYFRVPYATGWTATVDGQPTDIERANTAFMAVWVDGGVHEIRLEYATPGLKVGMLLSAVGLAGTVALALVWRRRERAESDSV